MFKWRSLTKEALLCLYRATPFERPPLGTCEIKEASDEGDFYMEHIHICDQQGRSYKWVVFHELGPQEGTTVFYSFISNTKFAAVSLVELCICIYLDLLSCLLYHDCSSVREGDRERDNSQTIYTRLH
jgi:hypothetical protein